MTSSEDCDWQLSYRDINNECQATARVRNTSNGYIARDLTSAILRFSSTASTLLYQGSVVSELEFGLTRQLQYLL